MSKIYLSFSEDMSPDDFNIIGGLDYTKNTIHKD